ncbi:hypothetical protein QSV08_07845 [Maribacter sp. BPC-D8]|uniref:hypothetical protein n=1 Tax=Maribacter sp. BPC-D8 TaxID=3053613 RepID=UPI002B4A8D23|nr:hypothetical protein [Maribacter sp. BPC-D8]WRI31157.1 hypothetical protein QSV08_07845 [Maribacter sp. BPC-D8]
MRKTIYLLALVFMLVHNINGQEIKIPENYTIVDSIKGDLDNDAINELVVAYNVMPENEIDGVPRELVIYKLENNQWVVWKTSDQALYGSKDGGMMGDPYGEMDIKNGILHISQNGGSSWKWGFTDKYRFQNDEFYLIGYTSLAGKLCAYWTDIDFNLTTGKMIVNKEFEKCENEEQQFYKSENETLLEKDLKITLQNRQEREIKITTPKYKHEVYIAIGKE